VRAKGSDVNQILPDTRFRAVFKLLDLFRGEHGIFAFARQSDGQFQFIIHDSFLHFERLRYAHVSMPKRMTVKHRTIRPACTFPPWVQVLLPYFLDGTARSCGCRLNLICWRKSVKIWRDSASRKTVFGCYMLHWFLEAWRNG
jgi:hypothetical protein